MPLVLAPMVVADLTVVVLNARISTKGSHSRDRISNWSEVVIGYCCIGICASAGIALAQGPSIDHAKSPSAARSDRGTVSGLMVTQTVRHAASPFAK